ncbi:MAG: 3-isopropylmalate dehydratase small subunit [Paracoccaceae bacterium]
MTPFTHLVAHACRLPLQGIDTDQLLPARFMSQPRAEGYGDFLMHDLARDAEGALREDFPLNTARGAHIMVARRNFGGGSSRESAVYALLDHGFRCVIAPSFGDIFAANATNNGLLAARVSEADAEALLATSGEISVDLERCLISCDALCLSFEIDAVMRRKLLNGWDDVDLTKVHEADLAAFLSRDSRLRPWAEPEGTGSSWRGPAATRSPQRGSS